MMDKSELLTVEDVVDCAWPGGYPVHYVVDDGGTLCPACVRDNFALCLGSDGRDGWCITGRDINWETEDLYCDNCNKRIEPAYCE